MRQILGTSTGVVVARMPRPSVDTGAVLVRVSYSFVSSGTELAPLRATASSSNPIAAAVATPVASPLERIAGYASLSRQYLGAAIRNPRYAAQFAFRLTKEKVSRVLPAAPAQQGPAPVRPDEMGDQGWNLGYSAAGEVVEVGAGVTDISVGDWVACGGAGQANHADYIVVRRNLVARIPSGCSVRDAATTTVGTIALQGVRRAAPQIGERIAVLGLGVIGQITVQMLHAAGCSVIGMDLSDDRVKRALDHGLTAGSTDTGEFRKLIRDLTGAWGVDRTLITAAAKSDELINLSMEITRPKGVVVIVGDIGLNVKRDVFYRKEIDLLMSTSYGPGRYDRTYEVENRDYPFPYVRWTLNRNMQAYMEMIANKRLHPDRLIDREVSVEQAASVYQEAVHSSTPPLGIVIRYETGRDPADDEAPRIELRGHRELPQGPIRYALIGIGAFGTSMLVPQMSKCSGRFALKGAVSRDTTRGGNFARAHQLEVLATTIDKILDDPGFDLAVIATRHHEHADLAARSLKAGKHVFVEKPLALTWVDLDRVIEAYKSGTTPHLLMVGFNRRFSPAVQTLQQVLESRRSPVMIQYRVHARYIPLDHWVHSSQGGGRNIGEACHMYDVFRFLAGSKVKAISAQAIDPRSLPYNRNDNFVATLAYEDGSVGTLTYTALGPDQGMSKERIEVFADGEAYVIDDFKSLHRASDSKVLWESPEVDKGHFEQLRRFGEAIANGEQAPIPFEDIVETSAAALQVEDLLFGRSPEHRHEP